MLRARSLMKKVPNVFILGVMSLKVTRFMILLRTKWQSADMLCLRNQKGGIGVKSERWHKWWKEQQKEEANIELHTDVDNASNEEIDEIFTHHLAMKNQTVKR